MYDYIERTIKLFPEVGGRICVFLVTVGVITNVLFLFPTMVDQNTPMSWFILINIFILSTIFGFFTQAITLLILKSHFYGESLSMKCAISDAWNIFPRIIRAWFVPMIYIAIGSLVCIIPGIFLAYRFYFITHEIVFCNAKAEEAKHFSTMDTEGWKGKLFTLGILLSLLPMLLLLGLDVAIFGVPFGSAFMIQNVGIQGFASELLWITYNAFFQTLLCIVGVLIFFDINGDLIFNKNAEARLSQSEEEPDSSQE